MPPGLSIKLVEQLQAHRGLAASLAQQVAILGIRLGKCDRGQFHNMIVRLLRLPDERRSAQLRLDAHRPLSDSSQAVAYSGREDGAWHRSPDGDVWLGYRGFPAPFDIR